MHTTPPVNTKLLKTKNNVPPRSPTSRSPRDVREIKKFRINKIVDELVDKRISLKNIGDSSEINKIIRLNGYSSTSCASRLGLNKNYLNDNAAISHNVLDNIFDEENLPYLFGESTIIDEKFMEDKFRDDLVGLEFLDY